MTNIRKARIDSGISQKEISISLGVAQPSVSAWEAGTAKPTGENLIALSRLLNVSTDYLLGQTNSPTAVHITTREEVAAAQSIAQQKIGPQKGSDDEEEFERIRQAYSKATPEQREEFAKIFERYVEGEDK